MKARKRQIAFYKDWGRMAVKRGRAVSHMKRVVKGRHWIVDRYNLWWAWFYFRDDISLNAEIPF